MAGCLVPGMCYPSPGGGGGGYGGYHAGGGGMSRDSSRDDLTSMADCCGGQIFEFEDRFRVDRRKLELLMMGKRLYRIRDCNDLFQYFHLSAIASMVHAQHASLE